MEARYLARTRLPSRQRRARLEQAVTPSPRLRLATAATFDDAEALELFFDQATADAARAWSASRSATRPALVAEVLGAELTLSPTHTAAWGLLKEDAGLALSSTSTATSARPRPVPDRARDIAGA